MQNNNNLNKQLRFFKKLLFSAKQEPELNFQVE